MIWGPQYPSILRLAQQGAGVMNTNAPPSSQSFSKGTITAPRTPRANVTPQLQRQANVTPQVTSPAGWAYYKVTSSVSSQLSSFITLRHRSSTEVPPIEHPTFAPFITPYTSKKPGGHSLLASEGPQALARIFPKIFCIFRC